MSVKTEECLTALDNHAAAQRSAQPICWKVSSQEGWMLLLAALPTRTLQKPKGCCSCDFPSCQSHTTVRGGQGRKEKSPPLKHLLPQLPRLPERPTEGHKPRGFQMSYRKAQPGELRGSRSSDAQVAALNVTQGPPPPCKYCLQRTSQLRTNMLLLHGFLLFMCSEEVSFLSAFL